MAGVNGIEIKVGQVWRCRDGVERAIKNRAEGQAHPWVLSDGDAVTENGRDWCTEQEGDVDLIELVQDENGFTIWRGGECPVPADAKIVVRFRRGGESGAGAVGKTRWNHTGTEGDIVAYKMIEQPTVDAKDMAADMLSDLGWHFRDGTWVQDGATGTVTVETPDSALAVQVGGSHYKDLAIQPIEYIHANKLGFCEGNVVKYITRHRQKHGADDIRKVIHYCQLLLELEYGGANRG